MKLCSMFLLTMAFSSSEQEVAMHTLLERVLDEPAALASRTNIRILDLFEALRTDTGVELRISSSTLNLLPDGSQTAFAEAEFSKVPLREGLGRLLEGLGLQFQVSRDHLEVMARPALKRICRRASWDELDTLSYLRTLQPGLNPDHREDLRSHLVFQVPAPSPWDLLSDSLAQAGAGKGEEALDVATAALDWSWYPWEQKIIVLPRQAQLERQMRQIVRIHKTRRPLSELFETLTHEIGVPVRIDPGAEQGLSPEVLQRFSIEAEGVTAMDVLDAVAAQARLVYTLEGGSVVFYSPLGTQDATASTPTAQSTDPVVGLIPVKGADGQEILLLLRRSDLSPEAYDRLMQLKAESILSIERALRP